MCVTIPLFSFPASLVSQSVLRKEPGFGQLMTSDQEAKVIAEPQVQQAQEAKEEIPLLVQYEHDFLIYYLIFT